MMEIELKIAPKDLPLNVDYTQTFEYAVAQGKYDKPRLGRTDKDFEHSSELPVGKVSVISKLFFLEMEVLYGGASIEDIVLAMDRMDCRPANIRELLAFGATYPEEQTRFKVVALGSVISPNSASLRFKKDEEIGVPLLFTDNNWPMGEQRGWGTFRFNELVTLCCFLGVSK